MELLLVFALDIFHVGLAIQLGPDLLVGVDNGVKLSVQLIMVSI
jgi:hypothetical protein